MSGAGSPEDRIVRVSNFCSFGPRPLVMSGLMRSLLTDHFSAASHIEHPELSGRVWSPTVPTGIQIEIASRWRKELAEKRPAVIIRRNRWSPVKLGIGHLAGTTDEGFDQLAQAMRGSHTLFCIGKEDAETEILGAEVYRYLLHFSQVIREAFDLLLFEVAEIGELGELTESEEHYVVPVTVAYGWMESWIVRPLTHRIKTISLSDLWPPECWDGES